MKRVTLSGALTVLILAALALGTALAGSSSTTLPNGAELAVSIDDPVTSTEFLIPAGDADLDVGVSGTASVGLGEPDATFVYVIDVSGSTSEGSGTSCSPILECERIFVKALNAAAIADGSVDEVGIAVYATTAATADMLPTSGDQLIVPPDADSHVNTVVDSTYSGPVVDGGVYVYTNKAVGYRTNFAAGLQKALDVVSASSNGTNIVVFLSDGVSNEGGGSFDAAVDALDGAGAVIHSVAVGTGSSCTGGTDGTLQEMADGTGGDCYYKPDPGDLPDIIPDLISSSLDSLEIEVDGGGKSPVSNDDIDPDLPQPGAVSVTYDTAVSSLGPGDHTICVTANGSDPAGPGSVTQCEAIHLFQISLDPETASNELGTPGQGHTVVATVLGEAGQVAGRTVSFGVIAGPNAGKSGTNASDANGEATFTYVAEQGCQNLATDTIQACFTLNDPTGETGCDEATKDWVDTTPPEVQCQEFENPHGKTTPPGKNPDGFYELLATDAVDPDPQIYLLDTGSGTVFGPFPDGTTIKYTEDADATPEQKKMGSGKGQAGAIDWHIIGNGDACVYAVDCAGNVAPCVSCLVPPPPK